jgi:hypothetical protein
MAINATNDFTPRELVPAGAYIARCYMMVHIGTVIESINGTPKTMNKVRIGWELPGEMKDGKPMTIARDYTLSMADNATLRKMLVSWRTKDFTPEEVRKFDVTKLLGVACTLNIIHKAKKSDATKLYEEVASVSPMMKGLTCPAQISPRICFEWDKPDWDIFEQLPGFIKDKMKTSSEFIAYAQQQLGGGTTASGSPETVDDLPF